MDRNSYSSSKNGYIFYVLVVIYQFFVDILNRAYNE